MQRSTLTAALFATVLLSMSPLALGADTKKPDAGSMQQSLGERVFAQNCSRCHAPPTSIPPRVTGTILMHMRTRARLSREEEQALLKFMAPK